ncbi:MAG: metallophosphoesterase [Verrucomicrobiota bacterium]
MLQIIHISDTHFGPDESLLIRGANAWQRSVQLVEEINALPFEIDFVVHTGDVVNDPDEDAYRLAQEVLSKLKAPVYYCTGNHDEIPMMRDSLTFPEAEWLMPISADKLCYRILGRAADDYEFFVMDGKVPVEDGPHGFISDEQLESVTDQISGEKPVAVFIHYPLSKVGSDWIDRHLLVTNGEEVLGKLRAKAGSQLRGIFTGHLHRGLTLYSHGVLQSGVSSPACEFTAGPEDDTCDFIPGGPIPFNHITFTPTDTWVKSYTLPFKEGG